MAMVELVRSWIALRDFAHFAHINVQGGHFFTLHKQFKKLYEGAFVLIAEHYRSYGAILFYLLLVSQT